MSKRYNFIFSDGNRINVINRLKLFFSQYDNYENFNNVLSKQYHLNNIFKVFDSDKILTDRLHKLCKKFSLTLSIEMYKYCNLFRNLFTRGIRIFYWKRKKKAFLNKRLVLRNYLKYSKLERKYFSTDKFLKLFPERKKGIKKIVLLI